MALSDFVTISIVAATATPTQQGFGIPLIAAQKVPAAFTNRVRTYSNLPAMVTDGFLTTDPAYLAAASIFAQTPRPPNVKIGRRALQTTQVVKLKCLSATQGDVYKITLVTPAGVATTITRTVPAASSTTAEATAILALINAVSGFSGSTSATDTITIASPTAGTLNSYRNWTSNFYLTNTSTNPGIATDLAAILAEDSNWYGLTIDSESKAEIAAAAVWAESNKKLFVCQNSESDVADNTETTNNIASVVKTAAYRYTAVLYDGNNTASYSGAAWQGNRFAGTPTPGNETWAYKTLAGIAADPLTGTQITAIKSKNAAFYNTEAGINVTQNGKVGSGEYIDVVRGVDWLNSTMQTRAFALLVNSPKVPYTQKGASMVGGVIQSALNDAEKYGLLTLGSSSVQVPDVTTIDSVTKGSRSLTGVQFTGQLSGAIESMTISGTVTL